MTTPTSRRRLAQLLIAPAMVGALVAGFGVASAQQDTPTTTAPSADGGAQAPADRPPRGPRGEELTAETAEKVRAAALAAVPGATVDRLVGGCGDSAYAAFVTKADGTRVVAKVNEAFEVTSVEDDLGPHGRGGPRGEPLDAATAEKVEAAALQAVPGGTVNRAHGGPGDGYHAHVTKADGTKVRVVMDSNFAVTSVDEDLGPRGGAPQPQA